MQHYIKHSSEVLCTKLLLCQVSAWVHNKHRNLHIHTYHLKKLEDAVVLFVSVVSFFAKRNVTFSF